MNENNFALVESHVLAQMKKVKLEKSALVQSEITHLLNWADSPDKVIRKTYRALEDLELQSNELEFPEYVLLANHPELIVRLVYHRMLLWGENTTFKMGEAWLLNFKRCCLIERLQEAKAHLPKFDYSDFLGGVDNVVFYELGQKPQGTSDEDYSSMRTWQYQKIVAAIDLKVSHFVRTFRDCYTDSESLRENIDDEIQQLQLVFTNGNQLENSKLKSELFKIKALTNSWLPDDEKGFWSGFKKFLTSGPDYSSFTVSALNELCSRYMSTAKACHLKSADLMGISLVCYSVWLEKIKTGEAKLSSSINTDFSGLFQETLNAALEEASDREVALKKQITAHITSEDYKIYLLKELDELRMAWSEAEKFGYLRHMDSKELLQSYFNLKCVLDNDPEIQVKALRASIKAEKETDMLLDVFEEKYLDPVLMKSIGSLTNLQFEVVALIHAMVPDSKFITHLWYAAATALSDLEKGDKPILFILNDLFEVLYEIYRGAEQRLDYHFQRIDGGITNEYIIAVKRELRSKFNKLESPTDNFVDYIQELKRLLDNEFDLVRNNAEPVNLKKLLTQVEVPSPKFTFGYKKSDKDIIATKIKQLVLDPQIDLLKSDTKPEDLVELLVAKDIDRLPIKPINLNCRTNQFVLIVAELSKFFSNLNPTNIEQSKRFYTQNGKPVKASNLYRAKTENPKAHLRIKQILQ